MSLHRASPPFIPHTQIRGMWCNAAETDRFVLQWVTSKEALGLASSTKRPTSCVMVAKIGMKKKLKEGEVEKEGLKELEEEFVGLYGEIVKTVEEMVSLTFLLPFLVVLARSAREWRKWDRRS